MAACLAASGTCAELTKAVPCVGACKGVKACSGCWMCDCISRVWLSLNDSALDPVPGTRGPCSVGIPFGRSDSKRACCIAAHGSSIKDAPDMRALVGSILNDGVAEGDDNVSGALPSSLEEPKVLDWS